MLYECFACFDVCAPYACPVSTEAIGVREASEPPCRCWESPRPSGRAASALTPGPSLSPFCAIFTK